MLRRIINFLNDVPVQLKILGAFVGLAISQFVIIEVLHHHPEYGLELHTAEELKHHTFSFINTDALITLIALGIPLVFFSWIIINLVDSPIKQIYRKMKAVIKGDLDAKLPVTSNDELGEMARMFNDMTGALKQGRDELVRAVGELEQFASIIAHDLKEPIRKISFYSGMVNDSKGLEEKSKSRMEAILSSCNRMQLFLNDLLDFSRVDKRKRKIETISLKDVINDVLEDIDHRVQNSNAKIVIEDIPMIQADKFQMRLLFQNLICNAIKFHKEGVPPEITIRGVQKDENNVEIVVKDNGVGLHKDNLDKIFNPFERIKESKAVEGAGLGLSTVKRIVDRHGGKVVVLSRVGIGSIFAIILPSKTREDYYDKYIISDDDMVLSHSNPDSKYRVLAAEDTPFHIQLISQALLEANVSFDIKINGEEAFEAYKSNDYNVILMDCDMPIKDGFQASEEIRKWEKLHSKDEVPIVAVSQTITDEDEELYTDAGMNDHMEKPVKVTEIKKKLKKWVG